MIWARECAAIIPCHDEALNIEAVVRAVHEFIPTVMVIDDGSRDGTAALAQAAGAQVLEHKVNRGKGAAIKTGLTTAVTEGFTWALLLDGDGQHAAADIPAFWRCAEATGAKLVVGNRMGQAEAMRPVRRFVNRWMSRQLSRRTGQELPDTQCGFRLVHLGSWSRLSMATEHFEVESEMLVAFIKAGLRVEFVPVQVIGKTRPSKIHPVWDGWRWFRWWWSR